MDFESLSTHNRRAMCVCVVQVRMHLEAEANGSFQDSRSLRLCRYESEPLPPPRSCQACQPLADVMHIHTHPLCYPAHPPPSPFFMLRCADPSMLRSCTPIIYSAFLHIHHLCYGPAHPSSILWSCTPILHAAILEFGGLTDHFAPTPVGAARKKADDDKAYLVKEVPVID